MAALSATVTGEVTRSGDHRIETYFTDWTNVLLELLMFETVSDTWESPLETQGRRGSPDSDLRTENSNDVIDSEIAVGICDL